jgi:transposase
MLFLARWARKLSWKETAEAFRTSWDKVFDAVEHVVTFGLEHRVPGQIDAIGVDEIQYAKGYLTLVYQIDLDVTRLLWVGRERTIESFRGFFTVIGDEVASTIVFVCSDMGEPYLRDLTRRAPYPRLARRTSAACASPVRAEMDSCICHRGRAMYALCSAPCLWSIPSVTPLSTSARAPAAVCS